MSFVTDKAYGRRGGHLVPGGSLMPRAAPLCDTCQLPMVCGQPGRHWSCMETCETCHRLISPRGHTCVVAKRATTERMADR